MSTGARTSVSRLFASPWLRGGGIAAAGVVAGLLLLAPSAATAKDEFEDAFKYELGRIAAHEAVGLGRAVLGAIIYGPPVRAPVTYTYPYPYGYGHPYPSVYEYHEHHHYYRHGPPHGRAWGHHKPHRHHRHHRHH